MKQLLKGGTVVSGSGAQRADVLVEGEKILEVAPDITCPAAKTVDCAGMLLFPGFIDAHTHFDLDVCNTTTADDFHSGGASALRGGTTMVIDFACPNKGESLQYGLDLWHKKADGRTACDYGFHMTIDDWNDGIIAEIPEMFRQGITSFKGYLTYPAMMIGDEQMFYALQKMKEYGGILGVHCENAGVIDALIAEKKAAGELSPASHPQCRPSMCEAEAISRLLKMAYLADVPVVIVHLSSLDGLLEIRAARARGQKVYVESCPPKNQSPPSHLRTLVSYSEAASGLLTSLQGTDAVTKLSGTSYLLLRRLGFCFWEAASVGCGRRCRLGTGVRLLGC